jgi:hypothetical protein
MFRSTENRTPSPINISYHLYSMIRNEILNGATTNRNAWPKGCHDIDLLFNFIKGKQLPRERVDSAGSRCKMKKEVCLNGCTTGVPCVYADKDCPIRSNEKKIKEFISKIIGFSPNFQFLMNSCNDVQYRKFILQKKLLEFASECGLTNVTYTENDTSNFDKKSLTNDFFKKTLKVNSFVLHAIVIAIIEPYVQGINSSVEEFLDNYLMLTSVKCEGSKKTCDPSLNPGGWYGAHRAFCLTQVFLDIFGCENSQLACSVVCALAHAPGTHSTTHGGRKSPGLTTAHIIWQRESQMKSPFKSISPTSVAVTIAESTESPRLPLFSVEDAPERPTKKPKEEEIQPRKNLFSSQESLETIQPRSGDFFTPFQFDHLLENHNPVVLHNEDSICNFDLNFFDGPCDQELMDIYLSDIED